MVAEKRQQQLTLQVKTKTLPTVLDIGASSFVELQQKLKQKLQISYKRQRIQLEENGLPTSLIVRSQSDFEQLKNDSVLIVKDLGLQVGRRTVYIAEYIGPLLIHILFYRYGSQFAYGEKSSHKSFVQMVAFTMVCFHYGKRLFESMFIHRFSQATMPLSSLFKNCAYYYGLGGLAIAYNLYHPEFGRARILSLSYIRILSALFFLFEGANFYAHLSLMTLRPCGTAARAIPTGMLFKYTSCPNYLFEALAWVVFSLLTGLKTAFLFNALGYLQMQLWATKKHRRYLKEFPQYPKERYAMVPFLPFQ